MLYLKVSAMKTGAVPQFDMKTATEAMAIAEKVVVAVAPFGLG